MTQDGERGLDHYPYCSVPASSDYGGGRRRVPLALREFSPPRKSGPPCRAPAMPNGHCWMHSGKSPGAPKGNRNAFKYGLYSAEAMAHLGGQMPQGPFDPKMKKRRVVMQHADVVEHDVFGESSPRESSSGRLQPRQSRLELEPQLGGFVLGQPESHLRENGAV